MTLRGRHGDHSTRRSHCPLELRLRVECQSLQERLVLGRLDAVARVRALKGEAYIAHIRALGRENARAISYALEPACDAAKVGEHPAAAGERGFFGKSARHAPHHVANLSSAVVRVARVLHAALSTHNCKVPVTAGCGLNWSHPWIPPPVTIGAAVVTYARAHAIVSNAGGRDSSELLKLLEGRQAQLLRGPAGLDCPCRQELEATRSAQVRGKGWR
eukprot:scaffold28802_cov65-Phaeocystis_antarctica.AAC.1